MINIPAEYWVKIAKGGLVSLAPNIRCGVIQIHPSGIIAEEVELPFAFQGLPDCFVFIPTGCLTKHKYKHFDIV